MFIKTCDWRKRFDVEGKHRVSGLAENVFFFFFYIDYKL